MKIIIGFGSPNKKGTSGVHGAPLGESEAKLTRENLGWNHKPFYIPKYIYDEWNAKKSGMTLEKKWIEKFKSYKLAYPKLYNELSRRLKNTLPSNLSKKIEELIEINDKSMATRKSSQVVLENIGPLLPELIGGSADLKESNLVFWPESIPFSKKNKRGKYIHYGVREFGMFAINNGIYLHGGFRPYGSTFLIFSEYAKNAIRMSALMHLPTINVFTHDSIGLGEDGPTHQAVEQLTSLRIIPGMSVWRPADVTETAISWQSSLEKLNGPSSLVLTRQSLPELSRTKAQIKNIKRGGYILRDCKDKIDAILISSGSEIHLCVEAAENLKKDGYNIRVVSIPCLEEFLSQSKSYQNKVIPKNIDNILAVEAGIGVCWDNIIGKKGFKLTMSSFGLSAPGNQVLEHFGFTTTKVIKQTKKLINKNR